MSCKKKHGTIIYRKKVGKSKCFELTVGGPYQATGGMGDTLADVITFAESVQSQAVSLSSGGCDHIHSLIADELSQGRSLSSYQRQPAESFKVDEEDESVDCFLVFVCWVLFWVQFFFTFKAYLIL